MLCPHSVDGENEMASDDMDTETAGLKSGSIDLLLPGLHETDTFIIRMCQRKKGDTIKCAEGLAVPEGPEQVPIGT